MFKISIIVPIYNVEKYLKAGIESVLSQTYKDYEIILVDDGSPDSCGKMCDEYAEKYDNIRVVHKENGGLSSARNAGLDVACGDYIYFFDPDDLISPFLLERCVERIEKDNADAVKFCFSMNNEAILQESIEMSFADEVIYINTGEKKLTYIEKRIFNDVGWSAWSNFFRHDIIKQHHLRFADNRKIYAEDMYFSCLFTLYAKKISLLGEPLYNYIRREDSIMGQTQSVVKLNEINRLSYTLYQSVHDAFLLENYHLIHHLIVMNQIKRLPELKTLRAAREYDKHLGGLEQRAFFNEQIKKHRKHLKKNRKAYGLYCGWQYIYTDTYLFSQNKVTLWFNLLLGKLAYLPYKALKTLLRK